MFVIEGRADLRLSIRTSEFGPEADIPTPERLGPFKCLKLGLLRLPD
jgi:hypothetical protein